MKTIEINLKKFEDSEEIHIYLRENLGFSSYYGNNLNALYDELTSLCEPITICFFLNGKEYSELLSFEKKIIHVFRDAQKENENVHLILS